MSWRERFGGADERAEVAARARALLTASGSAAPSTSWSGSASEPAWESAWESAPTPSGSGSASTTSAADRAAPAVAEPVPRWPASWPVEPVEPFEPVGSVGRVGPVGPEPLPSLPRGGWVPGRALGGSGGSDPDPAPVADLAPIDDGRGRHTPRRAAWAAPLDPPPPRAAVSGWRERMRFDPGRRGLVAVAAVVVVVGSVAGGVLFRGGSSSAVTVTAASGAPNVSAAPEAVDASTAPVSSAAATSTPTGTAGSTVTVDVAGLVARPGVYTLPTGSRVEDALTLAGGPLPGADLATVNRARVLVDGEQLAVGVAGAVAVASPAGGAVGPATGGIVDLNTADLAELDTLPGVGPVLAQAILDYRTDHGRFDSVDQLQQVSGIGPSKFADVKDLVTV